MISLTHHFAESHVPRTGGTSRHTAFQKAGCFNQLPLGDDTENTVRDKGVGSWHWPANRMRTAIGDHRWRELFTYSIARHPLEVVLSTYYYRRDKLQPPNNHLIPKDKPFVDWVLEEVATDPIGGTAELSKQSRFWLTPEGECCVDKIYNFHDLPTTAWADITQRIGIDAELPDVNGTGRKSVDEHYTPEIRSIVMERFAMDAPVLAEHGICW